MTEQDFNIYQRLMKIHKQMEGIKKNKSGYDYDEKDAPMEPDMVKHILRRCEADERLSCFDPP